MTAANLKKIKERLLNERELLIEKLKGNDLSIDDAETPDPVDLAVRNYSKNVMLAVSENESRQLVLVDEALLRVEDEEYGHCQAERDAEHQLSRRAAEHAAQDQVRRRAERGVDADLATALDHGEGNECVRARRGQQQYAERDE